MKERIEIFRWLWRSYARTALVPLLLVEVALVTAYLVTHNFMAEANVRALEEQARNRLGELVASQSNIIGSRLETVVEQAEVFQSATARVFTDPAPPPPGEAQHYRMDEGGAYHTVADYGGSAVFYSGAVPVGEAERLKAQRTAVLDPLMADITRASPLVMQLYLNTYDSLNRIYPYFDVLAQYPAKMNIPEFNFYYEADAAHNPKRGVVWTDVYLDPAGQGWMASCIAPVYNGDFLEGVVGLDVTVEVFIRQVLNLQIPWGGYAMLLDRNGVIMAMPPAAEIDLELDELTTHHYSEAIRKDELKPEAFNIRKHTLLAELGARIGAAPAQGFADVELAGQKLAAWSQIPQTGWTLLAIIPEANIFADSNTLAGKFRRLGLLMITGMVLFYMVFFFVLYRQARIMAGVLADPVRRLSDIARSIGEGHYTHEVPQTPVLELQIAAEQVIAMGTALGQTNESLRAARDDAENANSAKAAFISQMTHELRTPMNAIIGFTQLLDHDRNALSPEHAEFVLHIQESARKLLTMINRIIEVTRGTGAPGARGSSVLTAASRPLDDVLMARAVVDTGAPSGTVAGDAAEPPGPTGSAASAGSVPRTIEPVVEPEAALESALGPDNRQIFEALLAEVEQLLEAKSFAAIGRFRLLREMVAGGSEAVELERLAKLVEGIQFSEAAAELRRLVAENQWRTEA